MSSLSNTLYESSEVALVQALREELQDNDYMRFAFRVALSDSNIRSAAAEIRNGQLRITVVGGSSGDLNFNLVGVGLDTLDGLYRAMEADQRLCLTADHEMDTGHESNDLRIKGHGTLQKGGIELYHRRWSDAELIRILDRASRRHNVNYNVAVVPVEEHVFVVTLASAAACRAMSQDGVKRRGLSFEVQNCIDMADSYERQYRDDRSRQNRAIPVAKIKDSEIETGDIVQGTFFRQSLRRGHMMPVGSATSPEVPELFVGGEEDVQDTQIRIRWRRVQDVHFYAMELWRDTVPDVRRAQLGDITWNPLSTTRRPIFPTTSKLVYAPRWTNARYWHAYQQPYGLASGQVVNSFTDGLPEQQEPDLGAYWDVLPPEPNTTYFYTLYVFDINRQVVGSNVLEVTTRGIRAKLSRDASVAPLIPVTGPMAGGTPCSIKGTRFHEGMRVRLGDKMVTNLVFVDTETMTFDSPEVQNVEILKVFPDLTIISDTGLTDVLFQVWTYTE